MRMRRGAELAPLRDVDRRDGGEDADSRGTAFLARSPEPWLAIDDPRLLRAAGRLVEITYSASLWDEPVRPLFRFETADGRAIDRIAPAPVVGIGIWIGRIPARTIRASVSPTTRIGPFSFALDGIRRRGLGGLLAFGLLENPRSTRSAILTRLIGWRPESDVNLAWAIGATSFARYEAWSKRRSRPIDLAGMDAPRFDWREGQAVTVCIDAGSDSAALAATLASLEAQVYTNWRALIVGETPIGIRDERVVHTLTAAPLRQAAGLVMSLAPGDRLRPHALACLIETARRHPSRDLFYGDEEIETGDGRIRPLFKPGWTLRLQQRRPFLGRCVFRDRLSSDWTDAELAAFVMRATIPDRALTEAVAIRRVLLRTSASPPGVTKEVVPEAPFLGSVAIIIPTKDQAGLLRRALDSIRRFSNPVRTRIVIIDNGSVEDETARLFAELRRDPTILILARPGTFNYSAMCNEGAAATDADVLVFLNDDTEALHAEWLDRLAAWASRADVGAVGAKLTYPDGRLQHVGVLLGMGESAGHFGALAAADAPGWSGRDTVVHEVSAVTGACLAVTRAKFEAVGGFDAINLPVELSDIDLCLKLAERGWACLVDPLVHLLHAESASRGTATFRRLDVYETQRAFFIARWRSGVRDDPFFHPGLSLYAREAALG